MIAKNSTHGKTSSLCHLWLIPRGSSSGVEVKPAWAWHLCGSLTEDQHTFALLLMIKRNESGLLFFLHSICKRSSVRPDLDVLRFCYHPESADLAESNGSLPPCGWLTAGTLGSAPGLTLGNKYAKPLPFIFRIHYKIFYTAVYS